MHKPTAVVALGGNALLRRGQPLEASLQRENIAKAARSIAQVAQYFNIVLVHGNGPQVGLLALQNSSYDAVTPYPLDILDAETQGMIGYMLQQELQNLLPDIRIATLLTQVKVDPKDPAFDNPTKPIGPIYDKATADKLAAEKTDWRFRPDGTHFRRVVPSPEPHGIVELASIKALIADDELVICAGGGGIPVKSGPEGLTGVEAVIDKDLAAAYLARELNADALLILTDTDAVYLDWGTPEARALGAVTPAALRLHSFAAGSMGPKVDAACRFAESGGLAGIGALEDGLQILLGQAGTRIASSNTAARTSLAA